MKLGCASTNIVSDGPILWPERSCPSLYRAISVHRQVGAPDKPGEATQEQPLFSEAVYTGESRWLRPVLRMATGRIGSARGLDTLASLRRILGRLDMAFDESD